MKRSLLIALFCVASLSGSSALVAQTINPINPLLLEVSFEEGWREIRTLRQYGEYEILEKDGPRGQKFVYWRIFSDDEESQRNCRLIVAYEIVYRYGGFFKEGNLMRPTDGVREFLGILTPSK